MSGTERRVSATEARVHFGELLDGVTARHDVVFVERAGKEVAVVVSVEDWEAACASRSDKWARANVMLAELHEPILVAMSTRAFIRSSVSVKFWPLPPRPSTSTIVVPLGARSAMCRSES